MRKEVKKNILKMQRKKGGNSIIKKNNEGSTR